MARSRNRRDTPSIATAHYTRAVPIQQFKPRPFSLTLYEDRRQFHPEGIYAPAKSFNSTRHRIAVPKSNYKVPLSQYSALGQTYPTYKLAFEAPTKVLVCVRRKIRKQVLHALSKTGKVGQNRPKISDYSHISC